MSQQEQLQSDHTVVITAAPTLVLSAFFDPRSLSHWWHATHSVTTPRPLGIYAIEWASTPFQDEVLGTLGGVFYGTVMEFKQGHRFFVANAYWLPPESGPIGPMMLEVTCQVDGAATKLRVRQSGTDDGPRCKQYYCLIDSGWKESLETLKHYLEQGGEPCLPPQGVAPGLTNI